MKKNTATKLLDAATPLLGALGWENVTVAQLTKAANLNSAAISYHFGGKEALYQAILENQFVPALQAISEADANGTALASNRLLAMAAVITKIKRKQPHLVSFWHYEISRHAAVLPNLSVKEYTAYLYQRIISILCYGISEKEFRSGLDIFSTAFVITELLHTPQVPAYLLTRPVSADEDNGKDHTVQAVSCYLQGLRRVPLQTAILD